MHVVSTRCRRLSLRCRWCTPICCTRPKESAASCGGLAQKTLDCRPLCPQNVRQSSGPSAVVRGASSRSASAMFEENPKARADLRAGTLYAIWGPADWIYYGQIAADKSVAFYLRRDRHIAAAGDVLISPIMSRMGVDHGSV